MAEILASSTQALSNLFQEDPQIQSYLVETFSLLLIQTIAVNKPQLNSQIYKAPIHVTPFLPSQQVLLFQQKLSLVWLFITKLKPIMWL